MTMPTVVASGREALAIDALAALFFDNTVFRTWVGAIDATAAKAFLWVSEVVAADLAAQPVHVVIGSGPIRHPLIGRGSSNAYGTVGMLQFALFAEVPSTTPDYRDEHGNATYWFSNNVDAVIAEMLALSPGDGRLDVRTMTRESAFLRTAREERDSEGDYFQVHYTVEYHDPG